LTASVIVNLITKVLQVPKLPKTNTKTRMSKKKAKNSEQRVIKQPRLEMKNQHKSFKAAPCSMSDKRQVTVLAINNGS
jgi:peroxiredoxin family protein